MSSHSLEPREHRHATHDNHGTAKIPCNAAIFPSSALESSVGIGLGFDLVRGVPYPSELPLASDNFTWIYTSAFVVSKDQWNKSTNANLGIFLSSQHNSLMSQMLATSLHSWIFSKRCLKIRCKYQHQENSWGYSTKEFSYTSVSSERWFDRNWSIAAAISDGGNLAWGK